MESKCIYVCAIVQENEKTNPLNTHEVEAEFILFGGEKYTEPFVAQGPYVMNTREEIQLAHHDYMSGKYGSIVYN